MFQEPCLVGKVLLEADLIGWAVLYVLARSDFLKLIGVLAGFFENREKPARFLDLLLEPFLPMPIYCKVDWRSRYRSDCRLTTAVYGKCVI